MKKIASNKHFILQEWTRFVKDGQIPQKVDKRIANSWARCKEHGIDPYSGKSNIIFSEKIFKQKLKENRWLIEVVKPYINKIYNCINSNQYIIFLTDKEGNLIYIKGDNILKDYFSDVYNFQLGASWSELAVGTTAVSIVINEKNPVSFVAEEKFCFELKQKACSAVPIFNEYGCFSGVLGVAANFPDPDNQIFGLLLAMEMAIENKLKLEDKSRELNIVNKYYENLFNSVSDAVILLDNKGQITDINKKGSELLSINKEQILGKKAGDIFKFNPVNIKTTNDIKSMGFCVDQSFNNDKYYVFKSVSISEESKDKRSSINFFKKCFSKRDQNSSRYSFNDIIGDSKILNDIIKKAKKAARNEYNILILGESGTGKELFAQAIHRHSMRSKGPFVALNCGAIPESLMESEFFGYKKGSFTGANSCGQKGKLELASGGTLFMDEIAEMPPVLQVKLLRVLEEKEFRPLGDEKLVSTDFRIIAATNKNLIKEVEEGKFREDLYWRLNVINLKLPPLRDRKEDIIALFLYFLEKYSTKMYSNQDWSNLVDDKIYDLLKKYSWPGNIRELENIVKRITLFNENSRITPDKIPEYIIEKVAKNSKKNIDNMTLDEAEKLHIKRILEKNKGNLTKTAKELNVSRTTIYNKIEKYNLERTNYSH